MTTIYNFIDIKINQEINIFIKNIEDRFNIKLTKKDKKIIQKPKCKKPKCKKKIFTFIENKREIILYYDFNDKFLRFKNYLINKKSGIVEKKIINDKIQNLDFEDFEFCKDLNLQYIH